MRQRGLLYVKQREKPEIDCNFLIQPLHLIHCLLLSWKCARLDWSWIQQPAYLFMFSVSDMSNSERVAHQRIIRGLPLPPPRQSPTKQSSASLQPKNISTWTSAPLIQLLVAQVSCQYSATIVTQWAEEQDTSTMAIVTMYMNFDVTETHLIGVTTGWCQLHPWKVLCLELQNHRHRVKTS